jgi:hypothetical protein
MEIKEEPEPLEEPGLKYIGTRKKKIWEFQKEVRFVLYASSKNHTKSSSRLVFFESVIKNINKPEIDCLYMKFDRNRFNNAEIILGPRASKTDMIIVESLITKYLPNFIGKVGKSSLGIR